MTGTEFEDFVVDLCRRDGCTDVRRVGGSHDNGADVLGVLPDGRSMVIQCKRYTPKSKHPQPGGAGPARREGALQGRRGDLRGHDILQPAG
ncbi:restriction endonuclease [Streptomyces sp. NPDC056405]|uniref:restriction endonuclease n=1 Tax=Streptomyces sp. NPDC056405 TaxID=3345811 RepID=UPI0035DC234B